MGEAVGNNATLEQLLREEIAGLKTELSKSDHDVDFIQRESLKDIQRLQEENARLREQSASAHGGAMATLDDWREKNAEVQRLKMELADVKSICAEWNSCDDERTDELEWAKNEIYRLDPRLAAARWGKR